MRINFDHGAQPLGETNLSNNSTSPAAGARGLGASGLGDDKAQLSDAGAQVTTLTAQVLQLPEVRQERVQALRQAVQSGNYDVNPHSVAKALADHLVLEPAA